MKIGMKLKQGRSDRNLTQEEAAKILNVSRSTISSWEVNRTYPDLDMLVSLSDLYDISLDLMLREDEEMVHTLSQEIQTSRKRKSWVIALVMLYIPILLFLTYLLWNRNNMISANQTDLFSFGELDLISFLMIGSLVFGLLSWGIPILYVGYLNKFTNYGFVSLLSLGSCATAINFQVIYNNLMISKNDIAGLMDTSGVITVVSIILLLGTLLLNIVSYYSTSNMSDVAEVKEDSY